MWAYRELLFFLTWRDIKVRYKQTVLGASWAIIQPFMTMVVFSLFFGGLAKIPSGDVPYPIFSFVAVVPWTFFANSVTTSSNSLVGSAALIKKVFFPRLVVPIASVLGNVVDFLLAFAVLILMMLYFKIWPTAAMLWIIPLHPAGICHGFGRGVVAFRVERGIPGYPLRGHLPDLHSGNSPARSRIRAA